MAMMISKFHKLIQSKIVWTIFAILISVAFVGVYTGAKTTNAQNANRSAEAGTLWGKKISQQEYRSVYYDLYVLTDFSFLMQYGQEMPNNDQMEQRIKQGAWVNLATLIEAKKMGLKVSNQEVIEGIRNFPAFRNPQTGGFDKNMYQYMITNVFSSRYRMSETAVEQMIRRQLLIQKVSASAASGAVVTEDEIKEQFHNYNDKIAVSHITFPRSLVGEIDVTEEQAKTYYTQNPAEFRMPEKAIVHYVQFPTTDFTNAVVVTDEMISQSYEQNKQQYMVAETATNDVPEFRPMEDVKSEIISTITTALAYDKAQQAAATLVSNLSRNGSTFKEEAENMKLEIVANTPAFAATDFIRGIDPTAQFAREAFTLKETPTKYYSDPVIGKETVYVIALQKKLDAFLPAFDVVKADAIESAKVEAANKAYTEKCEAIETEVREAIKAGTSFNEAIASYEITPVTTELFSIITPLEGPNSREIMGATLQFKAGTLTDLFQASSNFMIAYVTDKEVAKEEELLELSRPQISAELLSSKQSQLVRSWQQDLLKKADFQDMTK